MDLDFSTNENGLSDPKEDNNENYTLMKYSETFYGYHTALTLREPACSNILKISVKKKEKN